MSIICCSVMMCSLSVWAEDELQRLFTTSLQRQQIDNQRIAFKSSSKVENVGMVERIAVTRIALDAMIISSQHTVVWINQQMIDVSTDINGVHINPKLASGQGLWIATVKGKRFLKQGQVYLIEQDKVVERYEAL